MATATEEKTVTRKINGKQVKLTPTENFIHKTGYRIKVIREQLKQLAKQHGASYEYSPEFIKNIEAELLGLIDTYLGVLRNPKTAAADGYTFDCSE
jgi:hypothetical protein